MKPSPPPEGPCNRCGAHKNNIHGLCGACYRFPAPPKKERPINRGRPLNGKGYLSVNWRD